MFYNHFFTITGSFYCKKVKPQPFVTFEIKIFKFSMYLGRRIHNSNVTNLKLPQSKSGFTKANLMVTASLQVKFLVGVKIRLK